MKKAFHTKERRKGNTVLLLAAVVMIITIFADMYYGLSSKNSNIVEGISDSLIRFHVIANSDSPSDQAIKLKVKDAVIERMHTLLDDATSIDESRAIIKDNMESLRELAIDVLNENGFNDNVSIALEREVFPMKQYGDIVLPPGEYEALIIRIGKAQGKNWWCVLFPPLCFVDATHGVIDDESKEELKDVLTDEEYQAIIMAKDSGNSKVKVKSKLLEWLGEQENKIKESSIFSGFLK